MKYFPFKNNPVLLVDCCGSKMNISTVSVLVFCLGSFAQQVMVGSVDAEPFAFWSVWLVAALDWTQIATIEQTPKIF